MVEITAREIHGRMLIHGGEKTDLAVGEKLKFVKESGGEDTVLATYECPTGKTVTGIKGLARGEEKEV